MVKFTLSEEPQKFRKRHDWYILHNEIFLDICYIFKHIFILRMRLHMAGFPYHPYDFVSDCYQYFKTKKREKDAENGNSKSDTQGEKAPLLKKVRTFSTKHFASRATDKIE